MNEKKVLREVKKVQLASIKNGCTFQWTLATIVNSKLNVKRRKNFYTINERNRKKEKNKERNLLRRKQAEFALSDLNKKLHKCTESFIEKNNKKYKKKKLKNENVESNHRCHILIVAAAECSSCSRWEMKKKIIRESFVRIYYVNSSEKKGKLVKEKCFDFIEIW